ncbi:MAG: hypothetical protein PHF31_05310 [Methylobacter sp.]|nr:hypothetical protein [Methylobacter sp.]
MKKHFHKLATYTALVLISSIPFPVDVFAGAEKKQNPTMLSSVDKSTSETKLKNSGRKRTVPLS